MDIAFKQVEPIRQTVHIALVAFVIVFKFLDQIQVIGLLAALLIIASVILPQLRVKRWFYRSTDKKLARGAITYFATLLALALFLPTTIVAVSWAVLAVGDGAATLIGKSFDSIKLPWNKHKTVVGSLGFVVFSFMAATATLLWLAPALAISAIFFKAIIVAVVAAFVESLPIKLDDNVSIPVVVAISLLIVGV